METRQQLRLRLRTRRQALSTQQQQAAAEKLRDRLFAQPLFQRSKHIAFYLPNDGELDPRPLIQKAWHYDKQCYLPVLQPFGQRSLHFIRYTPDTRLRRNRYGIPEPTLTTRSVAASLLDLVLLPLVGFDARGGRIGMGGGFYDRTFAFRTRQQKIKPFLLGLAHSCQQVESLPVADWDVPLDSVITEREIIVTNPTAERFFSRLNP